MSQGQALSGNTPIVCIIDDEISVRKSLMDLFESVEMEAAAYEGPRDFLRRADMDRAGCILLDVLMPEVNGLDFQIELANAGNLKPIVFMSGYGTVPMTVQAIKAGASDFLLKPFTDTIVISAASNAIDRDARNRERKGVRLAALAAAATLTPREKEVMTHVTQGLMNKQIAYEMQISEIMVKLHRGRMMKKMKVRSIADLVRRFDLLADDHEQTA